jgi:hypothetical protein
LAERYKDEAAVGGYDLLNEPLPNWNSQYNTKLVPLYHRLIKSIRAVDPAHIIVLEGVHWATDVSIFAGLQLDKFHQNIVLEFHKYWSNPDRESLEEFVAMSKQLEIPLWMGEGGENNTDWYTTVFPMYERNNIGWCFWSYKKMDTYNSPVSFEKPEKWDKVLDYIDGKGSIGQEEAREIFNALLDSIHHSVYRDEVVRALNRKAPIALPCYAYDAFRIASSRVGNVDFRVSEPVSICFADGHTGIPDWKRYGGEEQPESEQMYLYLRPGDAVGYRVDGIPDKVEYDGEGTIEIQSEQKLIWIKCIEKEIRLKRVVFTC